MLEFRDEHLIDFESRTFDKVRTGFSFIGKLSSCLFLFSTLKTRLKKAWNTEMSILWKTLNLPVWNIKIKLLTALVFYSQSVAHVRFMIDAKSSS